MANYLTGLIDGDGCITSDLSRDYPVVKIFAYEQPVRDLVELF